jgi:hypothetical protein
MEIQINETFVRKSDGKIYYDLSLGNGSYFVDEENLKVLQFYVEEINEREPDVH